MSHHNHIHPQEADLITRVLEDGDFLGDLTDDTVLTTHALTSLERAVEDWSFDNGAIPGAVMRTLRVAPLVGKLVSRARQELARMERERWVDPVDLFSQHNDWRRGMAV
jgi:hypothetical protein